MKISKSKSKKFKHVLAFDPGEHSGIAFYDNGVLRDFGAADGRYVDHLRNVALRCMGDALPTDTIAVIEDGFGRGIGAKTLDRRRGICVAAAQLCGIMEIRFIYPSTWQSVIIKTTKTDTKEASLAAVAHLGVTSHDVADAIHLGKYAVDTFCEPVADLPNGK